ncbi:MAG: tRNA (N6-isopentenyl adenosine(37)-C2)-methylthiotransferase MiaB [Flavobacteriales bacterium]|nr:tRNA (N6-isopentenyl adenosine(37)-C2)-methylthiotransferase MiaB [Flavobacteriales bacterium]MCW8913207.1 tRNA (N6-isopentenyl adenosine(37)-C2)-methylthiotransferase MiaB [Flavobacteriales bacterium]MCW8937384.1 tRNA (N6-isopentenyl adenosine(37)-C2)-methylthiotransferase MiaB [Flavobacteriales bacterium]MCW8939788.1 tRNA (N6-isopentenyl adenosine(37)-C2)-methylthiotransferase MiaB [Flavobacteriales bacterium]MCW8969338.1 tRNA (N6-isopentenyl adenosine(37)-C2)-methylthiotransferase MiaB [F
MELGNKVIDEAVQGSATLLADTDKTNNKKVYIESYGCQMNFSDSEIVASILAESGYGTTNNLEEADVVLVNTCSIREKAEQTVRQRLTVFNKEKKKKPELVIGVLGCMAERLKSQLLEEEKIVDIVVGPDAYRDLPNLVAQVDEGKKAVNVILSKEETYGDISPVRLLSNGVTAFISITRGCDNMCTFCVVPFTRGRERSRNPESILKEAQDLFDRGYREVTLLGQNVDSYLWYGTEGLKKYYENLSEEEKAQSINFAQLMEKVAQISPKLRVRFSTSHPKDMTDEFLHVMAKYDNICNYIHLPFQSGSNRILEMMNRGYTREWYMDRIDSIRKIVPDCSISADIIAGFCSETEEDHQDTLSLMDYVKYDFSYMFNYSERPNTQAQRKFKDDVPQEVKSRRLQEIIDKQSTHSLERNQAYVGKTFEVLVEKKSKRSDNELAGRTSQNTVVVFPKENYKVGDYVTVYIEDCTGGTLLGRAI